MDEENIELDEKSAHGQAFEVPPALYRHYHAHIYFTPEQFEAAGKLREKIKNELSGKVKVYELYHRPIGPHPLPMFEVDFLGENYLVVVNWLIANRGELQVLIHPLSGDAVEDHTIYAQFLGAKLSLDLSVL